MKLRGLTAAACVLAACCMAAALVGTANANHSGATRVSVGAINGQGAFWSALDGSSADGTRFTFHTNEPLVASDTDDQQDLYERAGTVTTHISIGPNGGNGVGFSANWRGNSEDGKHIFFTSTEPLVASDNDGGCTTLDGATGTCNDVYEYFDGTLSLLSTGPTGGNGNFSSSFRGNSADGSRVFMRTPEQLTAGDTDNKRDLYERSGGTTTLISTGPSGGNGAFESFFRGNSKDGTRAFFETEESLVASDTDSSSDVYERSGGTTTLLSTGPNGGNAEDDANYRGSSSDGSHVFFETDESLVASDTDSAIDAYDRSGGTTTLISTGAGAGSGDGLFEGASEGGTRVFFTSPDQLSGSDTDNQRDLYERSGSTTTLLSTGPTGGNGAFEAVFQGVAKDGSHAVFGTRESMVGADTDGRFDLYDRAGGVTNLVSTGTGSTNGAFDAFFKEISTDGSRVIFETLEQIETSDTDAYPDLYERFNGATTRLSTGATGGNAAQIATFLGASDDATRVFFQTGEALDSTDTDTQTDTYQARVTVGYPRPKSATPMQIPLVVAYKSCATPAVVHAPPALAGGANDPSCAPPVQESNELTVGTADSNAKVTSSTSGVRFRVQLGDLGTPADEADVVIMADINDVYHRPTPVTEYSGEVSVRFPLRITDRLNGSVPQDTGTVTEFLGGFTVPCVGTPSNAQLGSSCVLDTTADTLIPGLVIENQRTIWQSDQVTVYDGGTDGVVSTQPNSPFMRQGVFAP